MGSLTSETAIRLISFVGILAAMGLWEQLYKRKDRVDSQPVRWMNNLCLVALDNLLLRFCFPILPVVFAAFTETEGWGLLNFFKLPPVVEWVAAIVVLDFIIYLQHVLFHFVPLFWQLHMVHHSDMDIDVTTAVRFHPIEIILSMIIKFAAIAALGPPAGAVFLFEIALNGTAMFNHANIYIPKALDKIIRLFIVTPDMHRVHHSVIIDESNTNFGFNLTLWDRLCGTYQAQPAAGHEKMDIGLSRFRNPVSLIELLTMPFKKIN